MKVILVVTTIAIISLSLARTTQAAPTQWNTNYPSLKDQLYKSIISQALSQQEDLPSTEDKDKEMAKESTIKESTIMHKHNLNNACFPWHYCITFLLILVVITGSRTIYYHNSVPVLSYHRGHSRLHINRSIVLRDCTLAI